MLFSPWEIDALDKQTCFTFVKAKENLSLGGAPTFWRNRPIPSPRLEVGQEGYEWSGVEERGARGGGNARQTFVIDGCAFASRSPEEERVTFYRLYFDLPFRDCCGGTARNVKALRPELTPT